MGADIGADIGADLSPQDCVTRKRSVRLGLNIRTDDVRFDGESAMAAGDEMTADSQIEVVLQRSGLTFIVPPDKSILQVLIEEGIDPMYDCQRGECGICQVAVLEGVPDHRDHILSDDERAGNRVMQICVSRAKTPRLVLDL
jgi:vanillate O-demethylase ferredoxin subunit